ncbi:MAG: hypothetical protein QM667_11700 [Asticcacaulis sp.]
MPPITPDAAANDNVLTCPQARERALVSLRQAMRTLRRSGLETARAQKGMR